MDTNSNISAENLAKIIEHTILDEVMFLEAEAMH